MKKSKKVPSFKTIGEASDFWDTHDTTDFLDKTKEVHFEIDIKRKRHLVAVEDELLKKVRDLAKSKGIASETLINLWLKEKVANPS